MFDTYYEVAKTILAIFGAYTLVCLAALACLARYDAKHPQYSLLTNNGKHRMYPDEDLEAVAKALNVIH